MTCREARDLFSARIDGWLDPGQREAHGRHLETCADCRREWDRFSRTVGLLHAVTEARAPSGFAARVIEAARREPWPRRLLRRVFVPLHVKLPLEAAAVLLVSTLVLLLSRPTPHPPRVVGGSPRALLEQQERRKEAPPASREGPAAAVPGGEAGERDRLAAKAAPPSVSGGVSEARKSAASRAAPYVAARPQGPFQLMGLLRPKSPETVDRELGELVGRVGGLLVRDAERVGPGSIVEIVVPREAYPRLEAGLRQIGDLTVETRALTFPDQVKVAVRISH